MLRLFPTNRSYVYVPFMAQFGLIYSNNGTSSTLPLCLSAIFGTFLHSVTHWNACTLSTKYGMVNLCVNNGSFVYHFWHICALSYVYPFNQIWHRMILADVMCAKIGWVGIVSHKWSISQKWPHPYSRSAAWSGYGFHQFIVFVINKLFT